MEGGGGTPKSNPGLSPTPLALMEKYQVSLREHRVRSCLEEKKKAKQKTKNQYDPERSCIF